MTISTEAKAVLAKINKELGEDALVLGSDMKIAKRFTSGSLSLDVALGGGWPANHWVEVIGMESHGKTFVTLKTIAANQALDPEFTVFWIAGEHYDADQAAALGVDNSRVIVFPTQSMEDAYQAMLDFAESRSVDCVVLDSYPALLADEEAEKDMDGNVMALGARLTGKFFRKAGSATRRSLTDPDSDRPILGIIINQYRDAIGVYSPRGVAKTTPGGKAKNYAFYVRVEVRRDEFIKMKTMGKGEIIVGQTVKIKTVKNKSAAAQQTASVDLYFKDAPILGFERGDYDEVKEAMTMGILYDVIIRRGAYFHIGDQKWSGKAGIQAALQEDLGLREQVRVAVLDAITRGPREITEEDIEEAEAEGTRKVARKAKDAA